MAKKRESYEMLDTSPPPKSPWGKFIGLAVLLICIGGAALAYVLWPSEEKKPPSPIPSVAKAPAPSPTAPVKEPETKKEPAAPTVPSKVEPERPIAEGVPTKPVPPKETASSAPAVPATEPPKPIAKPKTPPIEPAKASEKVPGAVATPAAEKKVPVFVLFDLNQADVKLSERDKLAKFLRDLGTERGEIILEGHACA